MISTVRPESLVSIGYPLDVYDVIVKVAVSAAAGGFKIELNVTLIVSEAETGTEVKILDKVTT